MMSFQHRRDGVRISKQLQKIAKRYVMTVTKKVDRNQVSSDALKYISEGASVRLDAVTQKSKKILSLRISSEFLERIDNMVNKRMGLTRNAWIVEAIQEKLERL